MRLHGSVFVLQQYKIKFGGTEMSDNLLVFEAGTRINKSMNLTRGFSFDDELRDTWGSERLFLYHKYKSSRLSTDDIIAKCVAELNRCKPYNIRMNKVFTIKALIIDILIMLNTTENRIVAQDCIKKIKETLRVDLNEPDLMKKISMGTDDSVVFKDEDFDVLWAAVEPLVELEINTRKYCRFEDKIGLSLQESMCKGSLATEYTIDGYTIVLGLLSSTITPIFGSSGLVRTHTFYICMDETLSLSVDTLCSLVSKFLGSRLKGDISYLNLRSAVVGLNCFTDSIETFYRIRYNEKRCMFDIYDSMKSPRIIKPQMLRYPALENVSLSYRGVVGLGQVVQGTFSPDDKHLGLSELEEKYGITFYKDSNTGTIYAVHSSDFNEDGSLKEEYLNLSRLEKVENAWEFALNIQRL